MQNGFKNPARLRTIDTGQPPMFNTSTELQQLQNLSVDHSVVNEGACTNIDVLNAGSSFLNPASKTPGSKAARMQYGSLTQDQQSLLSPGEGRSRRQNLGNHYTRSPCHVNSVYSKHARMLRTADQAPSFHPTAASNRDTTGGATSRSPARVH